MRSRNLILCFIVLTLLATCLAAAAKLRATPKYDRIRTGMTRNEVWEILGPPNVAEDWECSEGNIHVGFEKDTDTVVMKQIVQRTLHQRLPWLARWRLKPPLAPPPVPPPLPPPPPKEKQP